MDNTHLHCTPLFESTGVKRKSDAFGFTRNVSLSLGLGNSSSYSTPLLSPGKEAEHDSSISLGLTIDLNWADNTAQNKTKGSTLENGRSQLDLELSLLTGLTESGTTTVTQHVDEGSTSSRWKSGPPLQTMEINPPVYMHHVDPPPRRRNASTKTCQFEGCTRGARGSSGLCIAHGGGRRCQREGCQKGAEGKTVFCKAHGGGPRCQFLGCTKSAEGRTDFCINHGGGRRCSHGGCTRAARGGSGLCIRHGGGKRCKVESCTKSAEGITGLCISHGGGRRCRYPLCTKGAQGSTQFCKAHGGGKRCTFLGCTKGAEGSTPYCKGHGGGKRCTRVGCTKSVHGGTSFCVGHGGGKRCAVAECSKSARGRTDFCVRHGGGKRCRFEGCSKSAQGSTDFCKAHGGGKRCCWGKIGPEVGDKTATQCEKFARGKSGLCAAHCAQMMDIQIQGSAPLVQVPPQPFTLGSINGFTASHPNGTTDEVIHPQVKLVAENVSASELSLPEGRVHGGSLMAAILGGTTKANQAIIPSSSSGHEKASVVLRSWV
ncbi:unnamed protein product [Cuscuta epithymum]|uniref:WRKY19-like zinc finger domain-containing protein n=1 Tax=Cuscuta epithymum TaxID=186058 RepID=A0AAV0GKW7_9ASTE|nr:unnamed protein product [Cuscuta epithymum]CAH9148204.1 unnamed protein product [Cuscuta epithymum]